MLGAVIGFALGVCSPTPASPSAGLLPYIVASQTVPILAIAPMVVVWVNRSSPAGLQGWVAVAGDRRVPHLLSGRRSTRCAASGPLNPRARADALLRRRGAGRSSGRCASRLAAVRLHRAQDRRHRKRRRRDHRRAAVGPPGRPRRRDPQLQPVLLARAAGAVGDEHRRGAARDRLLPGRRARRALGGAASAEVPE